MNTSSAVDLLRKWDFDTNQIPFEESVLPYLFELQAIKLLAEGEPVSAEMVGEKLGIPARIARLVFEASRGKGEWDHEGRLIGSALTLNPTPHRFKIKNKDLYTWCAHDTIFLPGLLGTTAEVVSPDPLTGDLIKLVIAPDGPKKTIPNTAVLTILQATEPATGPQSAVCTNSHYFISRSSAESWSKNRPGIKIMSIEDAFTQIKQNFIDGIQPILDQLQ